MPKCQVCNGTIFVKNKYAAGQKPKYCSGACKAAAWRSSNPKASKEQQKRYSDSVSPKLEYKECSACRKEIPFEHKGPGVQTCSKECSKQKVAKRQLSRYHDKIQAMRDAKTQTGCACCSYHKYGGALDFHHVDPGEKTMSSLNYDTPKLRREITKCVLVCKNCHAELHNLMRVDRDEYHNRVSHLPRATIILQYLK